MVYSESSDGAVRVQKRAIDIKMDQNALQPFCLHLCTRNSHLPYFVIFLFIYYTLTFESFNTSSGSSPHSQKPCGSLLVKTSLWNASLKSSRPVSK